MKSILDPSFVYVPAVKSDIRQTFKRIRAKLKQEELERKRLAMPTPEQQRVTRIFDKRRPKDAA